MYWPSRVGTQGKIVNVSAGKRNKGVIVPAICMNKSRRVSLRNKPEINPNPISTSQDAKIIIADFPDTIPKESISMVRVASDSAELTSGKNFRKPYHKKIIPTLRRRKRIPLRAIHCVSFISVLAKSAFFSSIVYFLTITLNQTGLFIDQIAMFNLFVFLINNIRTEIITYNPVFKYFKWILFHI